MKSYIIYSGATIEEMWKERYRHLATTDWIPTFGGRLWISVWPCVKKMIILELRFEFEIWNIIFKKMEFEI